MATPPWTPQRVRVAIVPLPEAFNNPSTPTLQVLNPEGQLVWQSKTYRSDFSVIQDIIEVMA